MLAGLVGEYVTRGHARLPNSGQEGFALTLQHRFVFDVTFRE